MHKHKSFFFGRIPAYICDRSADKNQPISSLRVESIDEKKKQSLNNFHDFLSRNTVLAALDNEQ